MLEVGKVYKTRDGNKAYVIWKCAEQVVMLDVFYVILINGTTESKPHAYFENGKLYSWSTLNFVDRASDIIIE